MLNSTVANNTAGRHGGGIAFYSNKPLTLNYTTVANNQSGWTVAGAASGNPFATGGGIYMNSGTLNLTNSILAQNFAGKFNTATALVQTKITPTTPAVPVTLANLNLGIHDDLYTIAGTSTITNSVYGATGGTGTITNFGGTSFQVPSTDWASFNTSKLDSKLTDNGGRSKTVYVFNSKYFQQGAAGVDMYDQTKLERFALRITSGAYENSVDKVLYYVDGEITKGRDGGSHWVSANGVVLSEADGVLNANNTTFVFENTAATLNYNWTINGPDWIGTYRSWIETRGSASLTVNAGTTAALDVTLNGEIIVRDSSTLILQSANLSKTLLSVDHTDTSNTTVYYGDEPGLGSLLSVNTVQTVLTLDAETMGAIEYDNLYLYGKDKVGTAAATLYTKNAVGSVIVNKDLIVGDPFDNVKLNITNNANFFPGSLTMRGANIHNLGQIAVISGMTVTPDTGTTTIDGGGTIAITGDLAMTNTVMSTSSQKTISVTGNLTLTDTEINKLATTITTLFTVSGNVSLVGTLDLTNTTITAGSAKTVSFGNGAPSTTVTMNSNVSIGSVGTSAEFTDNTNVVVTGLNNQILSNKLTGSNSTSLTNWTTGTITVNAGSLKINIGAQNLIVAPTGTTSTPTLLTLGLDKVSVTDSAGYFGVITTGTVTSAFIADPAPSIFGTLSLSGKIALNNTFFNVVQSGATLELGGTVAISNPAITMLNSLSLLGTVTVDTKFVPANLSIQSVDGSISLGSITGIKGLTINAATDFTLTNSLTVGGDLSITAGGNISSNPAVPVKTLNVTGNVAFSGDVKLNDITVIAGSGKLITFNNNLTLNGNTTIGNIGSSVKFINTNVNVTNLNNNIVTKGLDVSTWAGKISVNDLDIPVPPAYSGALSINIGTQALGLIGGNTAVSNAALTTLTLGLDRLEVSANNRLAFVTTNTATSITATGTSTTVLGTLALSGKIDINQTSFTIALPSDGTLELGGTVTIKKNNVGDPNPNNATITMPNSIVFASNVIVDPLVTGTTTITSIDGSITVGSNQISGAKFTGSGKGLVLDASTNVTLGNIIGINNLTATAGNNIYLNNSITVTGTVTGTGGVTFNSPNHVQLQNAYTSSAMTVLSPIVITAGTTFGTITGPGFDSVAGGSSELQLTAGSTALVSNIGPVSMTNSLTFVRGNYASGNIKLTGNGLNLITKANLNVAGYIDIAGNGKLENSAGLTVGDIKLAGGLTTSVLNNLATGTISAGSITLDGSHVLGNINPALVAGTINAGGFSVTGSTAGGYLAGDTIINVTGFNGQIAKGSYVTIDGVTGTRQVLRATVSLNGGVYTTSITLDAALGAAVAPSAAVDRVINTGVTTISVTGFTGVIANGSYITIAGDVDGFGNLIFHKVVSTVGAATPTSITFSTPLVNSISADAVISALNAVNHVGGYAVGTTTVSVGFTGAITTGSYITFAGDVDGSGNLIPHKVLSTVGGATPTSITFSTPLVHAIADNAVITKCINPGITSISVAPGLGPISVGSFVTIAGDDAYSHRVMSVVGGNTPTSITLSEGLKNPVLPDADLTVYAPPASLTNAGTINVSEAVELNGGNLTNSKTFTARSIENTFTGNLNNSNFGNITNSGTMTMGTGVLGNNITLVSTGTITNTGTISAYDFNLVSGNLINSKTLTATNNITFAGNALTGTGSLTNAGTMDVTGNVSFDKTGALNNNTGTMTLGGNLSLVDGTLTNKAALSANGIVITGKGSLINSLTLKTNSVSMEDTNVDPLIKNATGNFTNSGTFTDKAGLGGTATVSLRRAITDVGLQNGILTNTGAIFNVDLITLTGAAALNNNTGTMTANTIDIQGSGTLTNKVTLSADAITINTGNLVNTLNLKVNSAVNGVAIALNGGGSLTNTGTMTTVDSLTLTGAGALNNNLGTLSARSITMVNGTLTNKAILNVTGTDTGPDTGTGLRINGTGDLVNTSALRAGIITLANGNLTNSGAGTIAETAGFDNSIITVNTTDPLKIKTLTNSGTSIIIDNLVLNGSNLNSSSTLNISDIFALMGSGTRNIKTSATALATTVGTLELQSDAIMSQGRLTATNFKFNGGTYFQMNNSTAGTTLEITGNYVLGASGLTGCDATHYFVTAGTSKVWIKPTSNSAQEVWLTDSTSNPVIAIEVTGNTAASDKLVGFSTFKPVTVNGQYNGTPAGVKSQNNSVNRVWTVSRTSGDTTNLTMSFHWDPSDKGFNLQSTAKLYFSSGTSWGTSCGKGTASGMDLPGNSFTTNVLINSGSYSVSNNPIMVMNDNSSFLGSQFDELKERFIDAIFGTKEAIIEPQMVAQAQERSAMENMFSQMANRGSLMERNKLFKTDIDLGLEALLAV